MQNGTIESFFFLDRSARGNENTSNIGGGHKLATTDKKCPAGYEYILSQGMCWPKAGTNVMVPNWGMRNLFKGSPFSNADGAADEVLAKYKQYLLSLDPNELDLAYKITMLNQGKESITMADVEKNIGIPNETIRQAVAQKIVPILREIRNYLMQLAEAQAQDQSAGGGGGGGYGGGGGGGYAGGGIGDAGAGPTTTPGIPSTPNTGGGYTATPYTKPLPTMGGGGTGITATSSKNNPPLNVAIKPISTGVATANVNK